VRDHDKQALTYARQAIGCKATIARRGIPYRGEHREAAKRAAADIERHSAVAKYSEPGLLSTTTGPATFAATPGTAIIRAVSPACQKE
jgi:hypothetical protein